MSTTTIPDDVQREVTHLQTCQFAWGGLFDATPVYDVHLVTGTANGTPGPTLCGIDRFADGSPGWSMGGGVTGPGMVHTPCPGCVTVAVEQFPGVPVTGMKVLSEPFRAAITVALDAAGVIA
jgi:hypothetical protein